MRAVDGAPSAKASLALAVPLLVSGRDEAALKGQARRWAAWLAAHPDVAWPDVFARPPCTGRTFQGRGALVEDMAQATQALWRLPKGVSTPQ